MAKGRIFGIKKSTVLRTATLLFFLMFLAYIFISVFWIKIPSLWFFGFCIFVGGIELIKSALFKYDSCLYLGTLLFGIGIAGHVFLLTNTAIYAPYYLSLAIMLASVTTYVFSGQKFHLIIAFSTLYVALFCLLYTKNLINLSILIAFLVPFLLLLLLEILVICFRKK